MLRQAYSKMNNLVRNSKLLSKVALKGGQHIGRFNSMKKCFDTMQSLIEVVDQLMNFETIYRCRMSAQHTI